MAFAFAAVSGPKFDLSIQSPVSYNATQQMGVRRVTLGTLANRTRGSFHA